MSKVSRTRGRNVDLQYEGAVRHLELHVGRVADLRSGRDALAAVCLRTVDANDNLVAVEAVLECEVDQHGTKASRRLGAGADTSAL